ncbi:MAG TPA: response regulator [Anaerolineales bacterium]|jgi:CheY-like chemotaxis protein|nr:response regulator [Anaerolineales bacterium]
MARILFVDDDPLTLETLKRSVELFGHQAILANSGEQAQSLVIEQLPDLIMTDMMLPDTDGVSLVKILKANPEVSAIPVVILSASPEVDASEISLAAGAEEFLTKPVRLDKLQSVIERYTGK